VAADASDELSRLRADSGLSRERVAAAVGYSAKSIERWEKGDAIDPNKLRRIRTFYEEFAATRPRLDNNRRQMAVMERPQGLGASPEPHLSMAELLRLPSIRADLAAFQAELIAMGATPEQEDSAMQVARDQLLLTRLMNGSPADSFTESEMRMAIESVAEIARRVLSRPQASARPDLIRQDAPMKPVPDPAAAKRRAEG
jgi:transcriptional regulator with XRE-family HTH domain